MKIGYFLDTGFLTLALTESLPGRWIKPWEDIKKHRIKGYVIEPVIAETFYQLTKKGIVKQKAIEDIFKMKSIKSMNIISNLEDDDSFLAGTYHNRFEKLSSVDCYVLATARRLKLKIYTTDEPMARAARDIGISCEYYEILFK
ncbi:MAG: type II toxin-antitoxin system VapC family toxin [Methanophagales archaeon ANME-1-THS]|nr:MAG: type II toxin-antitoxin system VapC family toxin [Methanophagales archaeon ANME-1-THS]